MYFPYVALICDTVFEVNERATAAYVANQCSICSEDILGSVSIMSNCPPLDYDLDFDPVSFNTPASDPSPWYNSSSPESGRFLGYRVHNVERPNQINRPITQRIGPGGGGVLGALNKGAIQFNFQLLLFACDEPAMEYGFRFMANRLACLRFDSQCDRGTMYYRDSCHDLPPTPSPTDIAQGLWTVENVVLTTGPVWSNDPIPGMRKYVRRAEFTVAGESVAPLAVIP